MLEDKTLRSDQVLIPPTTYAPRRRAPSIGAIFFESLFYLFLLFTITQKEFIFSRVFGGEKLTQGLVACVIIFSTIRGLFIHRLKLFSPTILTNRPPIWLRAVVSLFLLLAFYLVLHELRVGDSLIAVKYAANILFLFVLMSLVVERRFTSLMRMTRSFLLVICVAAIAQTAMVAHFDDNDLHLFEPIEEMYKIRNDDIYRMPYGLGFTRDMSLVSFFSFEFYRANSFCTEPKYFTLLIWIGISLALLLETSKVRLRLTLAIFGAALFVSHAYTSGLLITLILLTVLFVRYVRLSAWALAIAVPCALGILPILVGDYLNELVGQGTMMDQLTGGFASDRLYSMTTTYKALDSFSFDESSLIGVGFVESSVAAQSHIKIIERFGLIGFVLNSLILLIVSGQVLLVAKRTRNINHSIGLITLLCTVLIFFGVFGSEFITTSLMFIMVVFFTWIRATDPSSYKSSKQKS